MSAQSQDQGSAPIGVGARGRTEPLASMLEYVQRLNEAGNAVEAQLGRLGDEYLVLKGGYGRLKGWSPDAIVLGPPAVFLIWVTWGNADKALWRNAELCRRHVYEELGSDFRGAVEIVFCAPRIGAHSFERLLFPPPVGKLGFNVLFAEGDLSQLLPTHEPPGGLQRLSREWIDEMRVQSQPRRELSGPDQRAQLRPLPWSPND